jgi:hypothetical protein
MNWRKALTWENTRQELQEALALLEEGSKREATMRHQLEAAEYAVAASERRYCRIYLCSIHTCVRERRVGVYNEARE